MGPVHWLFDYPVKFGRPIREPMLQNNYHAFRYLHSTLIALICAYTSTAQEVRPRMPSNERGGDISGNTYCAPLFFNDGSTEHFIDGVVLGSITNSNTDLGGVSGWEDRFFSGYASVTFLERGLQHVLAITGGPSTSSYYYAWLDRDRDGAFDASEALGHVQGAGPGVEVLLTFNVGNDIPTGYTGLRIMCLPELIVTPDPCGPYAIGEAEDYAVLIGPGEPCLPVHYQGTTLGDYIAVVSVDDMIAGALGSAGQFPYRHDDRTFHLEAGSQHDLIVGSGEYDADRFKAWVDWNNDGDWDDADELLGEVLASAANTLYLLDLNVPADAWGWCTMRLRCADSEFLEPCNDEMYGETRDYMVVVDNPLLPCLTYSAIGTENGLGMEQVVVNGSSQNCPSGPPNHWVRGSSPVVHVAPGDALDVSVSGNVGNNGNLVVGYVDLNNDLDFDDAGETGPYVNGTTPNQVMTFSLAIPAGTVPGGHWLRVSSYGEGFEFVDGCRDPAEGQVMDILFIVDGDGTPCIPGSLDWTSEGDFIEGVALGAILNMNTGARYGAVYTDYSSLSTDVFAGQNYDLTIYTGENAGTNYHAWVDLNNDGDLTDANEFMGSVTNAAPGEVVGLTVTIPNGTSLGPKRLRVRCSGDQGPDPCADSDSGETEDYRVDVTGTTGLNGFDPAALNVSVTNDGNSMVVSWPTQRGTSTITLVDATGRIVLTTTSPATRVVLPTGRLAEGVYTIVLDNNGLRSARRTILAR